VTRPLCRPPFRASFFPRRRENRKARREKGESGFSYPFLFFPLPFSLRKYILQEEIGGPRVTPLPFFSQRISFFNSGKHQRRWKKVDAFIIPPSFHPPLFFFPFSLLGSFSPSFSPSGSFISSEVVYAEARRETSSRLFVFPLSPR